MQNKNVNNECVDDNCPYAKPHKHVRTNDGCYVKYIIEKPKTKESRNADTW